MDKEQFIFAELFNYDLFVERFKNDFRVSFKKRDVRRIMSEWLDSYHEDFIDFMWVKDYISERPPRGLTNTRILELMGVDKAKYYLWASMYDENGDLIGARLKMPVANMDTEHILAAYAMMEKHTEILNTSGRETMIIMADELTKRQNYEKTIITNSIADSILNGEPDVQTNGYTIPRAFQGITRMRAHIQ
jgi:hypothetical protein